MDIDVKIEDCSIILSYNFIYDETKVTEIIKDKKDIRPKFENLLSYVDRLFENNRMIAYQGQTIYIYINNVFYKLEIEDMNIIFFENEMAILYLKLVSTDFKYLEKLYRINRALTNFYTKKNDNSYVFIGKKDPFSLKLPIAEFEEKISSFNNVDTDYSKNILEALTKKEIPNDKTIFNDEYLTIKNIAGIIHFTIKKNNKLIQALLEKYHSRFNPHSEKKSYPFSDEHRYFKGRVGLDCKEHNKVLEQNKEFTPEKECNRHYLYFDNQKKVIDQKAEKMEYEFIHYDTFVTSLIIEYVKPNEGFQYYDTFNPKATSYINSYITLVCNSDTIDREYEKKFISFEPLLSSKIGKGKKITTPDFFHIYQSQADIFTLGNSHSIVHIIDEDAKDMKVNKEKDHFFIYLLTCIQRSLILNIINSSIVNINRLENNSVNLLKIKKIYHKLSAALDDYNHYLTNVNFKVISNSSSIDNSYNFFRECNDIDKLTMQWNNVALKFNDWKNILSHILRQNPLMFFIFIALFGLIIKVTSILSDKFISYVSNIFK